MDYLKQQQLTFPIVQVFQSIEEQILINVAKRLAKHKSLLTEDNIHSWQSQKLAELDSLSQDNIITIAKHAKMAIDEVTKMLKEAGYSTINQHEKDLQEAVQQGKAVKAPPIADSEALNAVIMAYQKQAMEKFNLVNTTLLGQSQQTYLDIVNKTVGKVLAGVQTPQEALREVAAEWAMEGLPALIDKSGRRWSTEGYVNMVTRSINNHVANDMQDARMDEYGIDLIEVSSHAGARPKCAPYQGKIFSRNGDSNRFPSLSSTSYGEPDGLRGINCGHNFYPYIPGVSKKRFEPFPKKENERIYKESQQQRYLERQIRAAKKELAMMNALGDDIGIKKAKQKVLDRQKDMRVFIDDTDRTRRREREQIH